MEIEAKFLVPERNLFDKLMRISSIKNYNITEPVENKFHDTYLDTLDMVIYASDFSFRCRERKGKVIYTLKSLKSSDPVLHMREENELVLPEKISFEKPGKNAEEKAFLKKITAMTGSGNLFPLFSVEHKRTDLQVFDEERHIAEVSFDDVVIVCDDNEKSYLELEIELMTDGREDELLQIASYFRDEIGLIAGSSSKFDNGMELLRENIRKNASILDYDVSSESSNIRSSPIREMFEEFNIEQDHARKVAENSLILFDSLKPVHHLRDELRHTLKVGALVHDIGVMTDAKNHHKAGRDILLEICPEELPWPLCLLLPWMAFLHKKKITEKKLRKLLLKKKISLIPSKMQDDIFKISAILRIADALDYSRSDTLITDIKISDNEIIVTLNGPGSEMDAQRADEKADMWRLIFKKDILFGSDH